MPLTPKRKAAKRKVTVRIPEDQLAFIDEYAKYLADATTHEYVIVEAARQVISKDRKFQRGRKTPPATATAPVTATSSAA